tara:strand:- start:202 stop:474 length:273 start_codon:yes stop_codon:yes gene_type:complete
MKNLISIVCRENKSIFIVRYFLLVATVVLSFLFISCTENHWQNNGDSCIQISEKPPLRRVINYTDHDLCNRNLPPRTPPNPQTRSKEKSN